MQKVILIGCPGSGKTTFAEKLGLITGLPVYHLDAIWHKPDRTHITREEFDERLAEILQKPSWIIDGNYNRTLETRLRECDTVFLFDLPTNTCILGALERLGKPRPDLPFFENELDEELRRSIERFPAESLPKIYALLELYAKDRQIIVFKSRAEADAYLDNAEHRKLGASPAHRA